MEGADPLRAAVKFLIVVLCGAALLLIVLILSGSDVDETGIKAIASAVAVAFLSLTAAAGLNLAGRKPQLTWFGYTTVLFSLAALLGILSALWSGDSGDAEEKVVAIAAVLALGSGHASLLLAGAKEEDPDAIRTLRLGVLLALALLCLLATIEIAFDGEDVGVQPIAVVAVLYALGTILLPLVRRGSPTPSPQPNTGVAAVELLRANGLVLVEGPVSRTGAHGPGRSVCLREPDGRLVELIAYDDRTADLS